MPERLKTGAGPEVAPTGYWELVRANANFRYLWFGQIASLLGDWFNLIASAALLAQLTGSGFAIGGLFAVRMLAPFLISPLAGVIADRCNRKYILILSDLFRAVTVCGFLLEYAAWTTGLGALILNRFSSASPPIRHPNIYGIDMPRAEELIAHERSEAQVCEAIRADRLIYQDLHDLIASVREGNPELRAFDCSVFTGEYVTGVPDGYLERLARRRGKAEREAEAPA